MYAGLIDWNVFARFGNLSLNYFTLAKDVSDIGIRAYL